MPADVNPVGGRLTPVPVSSTPVSTNTYALPIATTGVAMNPPPPERLPSIMAAIDKACAVIPADKNVALVGIATKKDDRTEVNAVLVTRVNDSFKTSLWFGRSWEPGKPGSSEVGASVAWTF